MTSGLDVVAQSRCSGHDACTNIIAEMMGRREVITAPEYSTGKSRE